jgi:hypothetical protein
VDKLIMPIVGMRVAGREAGRRGRREEAVENGQGEGGEQAGAVQGRGEMGRTAGSSIAPIETDRN